MARCTNCFHYNDLNIKCNITNLGIDKASEHYCGSYIEVNGVVNKPREEQYLHIDDGGTIRKFETGATRDTDVGKLSYVKALSPIVLQRYVNYLDKHRIQSDGNLRSFDNWKQGIEKNVYFDSLGRHFLTAWLLHDGFPAFDNHGPVTLEDALCGIIFNTSGWLHEILKEKKGE